MAVRASRYLAGTRTRVKGAGQTFFDPGSIDVRVEVNERAVRELLEGPITAFGRASAGAVKEARETAVEKGRAHIRSVGFPAAWADGLQSRQYPKAGKGSLKKVQGFVNHRFGGVATVFEFGTKKPIRPITAKYLWIPVEGSKKSIYDPRANNGRGGSVRRTAGRVFNISKKGLKFAFVDGKPALVTRDSKAKKPKVQFWGVKQVTIPKKWNVMPIIEAAAAKLPGLIEKNLSEQLRKRGGK